MASYARSLQSNQAYAFKPTMGLVNHLGTCGQPLFGWTTPAGLPDVNARWLGANALWQRWNLIAGLTDNWWQCGNLDAFALAQNTKPSTEQVASLCATQVLHYPSTHPLSSQLHQSLIKASGQKADAPLTNAALAKRMLAWSAMTPDFQVR